MDNDTWPKFIIGGSSEIVQALQGFDFRGIKMEFPMIHLCGYGYTLKRPFAKRMSFKVDLVIQMTKFIKYAPKCQLRITNIADEIINI